ncbi:MAG: hypothetical protein JW946_01835 [Candidatus Omnitrophica bacterium]|nr:hypothetical protein [Candidatus Omnitrophota bacterium]
MIRIIALIASIVLPLWNMPLIVRIIKRKSSEDISVLWAVGVWICLALILPAGLTSTDFVFKTYTLTNSTIFTAVMIVVLIYRHNRRK